MENALEELQYGLWNAEGGWGGSRQEGMCKITGALNAVLRL